MKKIDFHIHTISSIKDSNFEFSLGWLKKYVEEAELDAIAITNHDLFDIDNFYEIEKELSPVTVFPGIELSLDIGHVNIVFPTKFANSLESFSNKLNDNNSDKNQKISCQYLFENLNCWKEGIYIFELGKSNGVKEIPNEFSDTTYVGGVSNSLRFNVVYKDKNALIPVLFSDAHATENDFDGNRCDIEKLKEKTTYIQADTCDFNDIKVCLADRTKVNINKDNLRDVVDICGNFISTGLNLVVGRRGTGKTHFLNKIKNMYSEEDIYYIPQFETANAHDFLEKNRREHGNRAIKDWQERYNIQFNSIRTYLNENFEENIDEFLNSIKTFANDNERSNSKNKFSLFKENNFDVQNYDFIKQSLDNIKAVIDRDELWGLLDDGKVIKKNFVDTYMKIRKKYIEYLVKEMIKEKVNSVIYDIKNIITRRTGISSVVDCDLSAVIKRRHVEIKIKNFLSEIIKTTTLQERFIYGYRVVIEAKPFEKAEAFRKCFSISEGVHSDLIKPYLKKDYITFLKNLKQKKFFNEANIAEYFIEKQVNLLDLEGIEASGGQAVGFTLAMRLDEAKTKPVILIDEPESSLDNAYIREELNVALKELSKNSMVVVITHNSTLGSLLNPDYLIVTSKNEQGEYCIKSGAFNSGRISSFNNKNPENSYEKFVEAMESGIESYNKKGEVYGNLRTTGK